VAMLLRLKMGVLHFPKKTRYHALFSGTTLKVDEAQIRVSLTEPPQPLPQASRLRWNSSPRGLASP
jgi:hypothetical protein